MTSRSVPLLAAAALATVAVAVPAGARPSAKPNRCGSLTASNGARITTLTATGVGCRTAAAVARRANGKAVYKTGGFTCRIVGPAYFCVKSKPLAVVGFRYRKRS